MLLEELVKELSAKGLRCPHDDDILTDEEIVEIIKERQFREAVEQIDRGFLFAHALFRHILRATESNPDKACEVLARYLHSMHETNKDNPIYMEGFVKMEEEADDIVCEFDTPKGKL